MTPARLVVMHNVILHPPKDVQSFGDVHSQLLVLVEFPKPTLNLDDPYGCLLILIIYWIPNTNTDALWMPGAVVCSPLSLRHCLDPHKNGSLCPRKFQGQETIPHTSMATTFLRDVITIKTAVRSSLGCKTTSSLI